MQDLEFDLLGLFMVKFNSAQTHPYPGNYFVFKSIGFLPGSEGKSLPNMMLSGSMFVEIFS